MDTEFVNNLFDSINHLDYVVIRNWRELPNLEYDHPDIDILVSVEHYQEMKLLVPEWVDLRTPIDGYFPLEIAYPMLSERRVWRNFFIPSPQYYFLGLYYHVVVHKAEDKFGHYRKELRRAFLEWMKPVKCEDEGVGYYDTY